MIDVNSLPMNIGKGNNAYPVEYRPLGRESRLVLNPQSLQDSWHIVSRDLILHCNQTLPEWFAPHLLKEYDVIGNECHVGRYMIRIAGRTSVD